MNEQLIKEDIFAVLSLLSTKSDLNQRGLSTYLGISLGKTNYLIKELVKIGFIEIKNFTTRDQKAQKVKYFLTKEGWKAKVSLTYYFLKKKESEYNLLRKEWDAANKQSSIAQYE